MTRSTVEAVAAITTEQSIVTVPLQARKIQLLISKVSNGVNQVTLNALKKKSIAGFFMLQALPRGMEEL